MSYDPNDKLTSCGIGANGLILNNQVIEYTISLKDTGNCQATNMNIVETLENNLDVSSFLFVEVAIHHILVLLRTGYSLLLSQI
ncbi:MAG: hypothetical protein IPN54_02360 [Bacteroidetes bacterium]|nr:hypothetical protein [Bacteroidota bacterium]